MHITVRLDGVMPSPYKGPRDQFIVRPTAEVGALIRKDAEEQGKTILDVCGEILAAHYGKPAYNPKVRRGQTVGQEELAMTG
jgi:hypothetical protein